MSEQGHKVIRILSVVGGVAVVSAFVFVYFIFPQTNVRIFAPVTASAFLIAIFNTFLAGFFYAKSPKLFFQAEVSLYGLGGLLLLHLTGGLSSPVFFVTYFAIVFCFLNSYLAGALAAITTLGFIAVEYYLSGQLNSVTGIRILLPQLAGISIASVVSGYYGNMLKSIMAESSKMHNVVQKLSSDKNKDDAILSSMADGVYVVDANRKVIIFNKAAEEMTGWKSEDAIGLNCSTVMKLKNDQDLSMCEKNCPMLLTWSSGENVVQNDMCFVNKYKKAIQVSGSYAPIKNMAGEITGGLCVFRDVTKQRALERQKDEFISTASHEMRTPLTALEGYISLVNTPSICQVDDKGREYLDKAYAQVIGMSRLMKDLLNITKIEEGKLEVLLNSFELKELIKSVIEVLNKMATEKGLELRFNESNISFSGKKAIGVSTKVNADQDKVREILNNLIENAIKYTKQGHIEVSVAYDQDFATVCVADTGVGISPDDQKHIFQKFYQVADFETREVGGTGLGLYITRSLVEANGGKVWVESKKGEGSKFFFTIPRAID